MEAEKILLISANIVVTACLFFLFLAILIDFVEFQKEKRVKKEKKSIVETGTMFVFFFLFYFLIKSGLGHIQASFGLPLIIINVLGQVVLIVGCVVNIIGRLNLGKNWSNQIKIYQGHTFVSAGMYGLVRHPLYASLIWMFLAASVVFMNYLALLSALLIFLPFMYYRAGQEEDLLSKEFENYKDYQIKTGMFFPKIK